MSFRVTTIIDSCVCSLFDSTSMTAYILQNLEDTTSAALSSLVFRTPFPENAPDRLLQYYLSLTAKERGTEEESHYDEPAACLAFAAYKSEAIAAERSAWIERATSAFADLVAANKDTLRHVELILPTGGIATPLNLFPSLKDVTNLESLSVQWPMRGYLPMSLILSYRFSHIIEDSIIPSFEQFHAALMEALAVHAPTLKQLLISLPESFPRKPFSALSFKAASFPSLTALELLDFTHWSPSVPELKVLLGPDGSVPNLQHLIIDHGLEISLTDEEEDDGSFVDYSYDFNAPVVETRSWPALGVILASTKICSLGAALHDARWSYGFAYLMNRDAVRKALGLTDESALVVCTAWPTAYEGMEPRSGPEIDGDVHLYEHVSGCGHLAYPVGQRPTTGLWPAHTSETRAVQIMAGRPWY
ncbi:hypothetical protein FB45DRAFT_1067488 [Roridomyces roridus]|uniref:Uncharacterized protein n=1 Tax=Roridomyces roridus TaxID=1738132 RepID=A0AAD7B304_9AGAR|nr:hypothetical protein FB45DRAFT_1067488 [Roridomyces roridus]